MGDADDSTDFLQDVLAGDPALPADATVALGYSPTAIGVLLGAWIAMAFVPIWAGFRRLPSDAPDVGCDSLAIAAACHISPATQPPPPPRRIAGAGSGVEESEVELTPLRGTIESWRQGLLARQESPRKASALAEDGADEAEVDRRARTAQSRLRWGVVEMPDGWREPLDTDDGGHVGHLSFGVAGCDVQPPVEGNLYA